MNDEYDAWVIVIDRHGYMGSVPYSQPIGRLAEVYPTREAAEAVWRARDGRGFVAPLERWDYLEVLPSGR